MCIPSDEWSGGEPPEPQPIPRSESHTVRGLSEVGEIVAIVVALLLAGLVVFIWIAVNFCIEGVIPFVEGVLRGVFVVLIH